MSKPQAVLFDLDGTLLDTLGDLADAMNVVLAEDGLPTHTWQSFRYFIGEGVVELVKRSLPEDRRGEASVLAYMKRYRESYTKHWHRSKPFAGIPDMLDRLQRAGLALAVVSNKPDDFTRLCVERLLPEWKFQVVLGQSERFPAKPDPASALHVAEKLGVARERCLFVGDSNIDMITGVNAGMIAVGVSWGFRPEKELLENGARHIVRDPREIVELAL